MLHLVRISLRFNRVLKNRGGRFLTVYWSVRFVCADHLIHTQNGAV